MSDMEELKKELDEIKDMCKPLEAAVKAELAKGVENIDAHEFGEVIDALKDLAEMKKSVSETKYYCSIVKAMEDAKDDDELRDKIMEITDPSDVRGYNSNRYANGRYAPSGRGSRRGYDSMMPMERDYDYPGTMPRYPKMYYTDGNTGSVGNMGNSGNSGMRGYENSNMTSGANRSQREESRYDRARRGYEESKAMHSANTAEDKQMNMSSLGKVLDVVDNDVDEFKENASPEEKNLMKARLTKMLSKLQ